MTKPSVRTAKFDYGRRRRQLRTRRIIGGLGVVCVGLIALLFAERLRIFIPDQRLPSPVFSKFNALQDAKAPTSIAPATGQLEFAVPISRTDPLLPFISPGSRVDILLNDRAGSVSDISSDVLVLGISRPKPGSVWELQARSDPVLLKRDWLLVQFSPSQLTVAAPVTFSDPDQIVYVLR